MLLTCGFPLKIFFASLHLPNGNLDKIGGVWACRWLLPSDITGMVGHHGQERRAAGAGQEPIGRWSCFCIAHIKEAHLGSLHHLNGDILKIGVSGFSGSHSR